MDDDASPRREVPRLVAIQGERAPDGAVPLYRHPADEQPELRAFTPAVDRIRREVERRVGHPLNHCLLQLYRTGRDWISEHSDKTLDRPRLRRRRLPPRLRSAQLPHLAGARRRRVSAGRAVYFVNGSISS
ncbi:uncharacterized protein SOCE26_088380 [Sorangium cellulosum]|uniref:Alpha-ketoglutarate-dependent dioxygenase AlkB-like domain-containing protein n=1 Tax=Sorangium cellulosum TaxID=56 RepID=A0A2L0F6Y4_SORCE|nr:hypothetical protein [Sorangium cellulosum]AUX47320.1 uncharacterized protein SOCE26_088380 [Sorangium cellulosum]